ncbi:MAG: XkdF-like putative serine protease domain-containing protein, partial [Defluviitaleaceae bacterium]|nr:XkdF-like putative serine protease domain-containing protein [Defluviitaleaceae bacterium]
AGEMHERGEVGQLVESVVFTKEKTVAMGIPGGILPEGWWVGFKIHDDEVWNKIKNGEYSMFSIEGTARRVEI